MKSMYIHIPFCKSICSYCDFCKMYYDEKMVLTYLDALKKEIDSVYQKEVLQTLYIGGGTPSHLSKPCLTKLFKIIDTFPFEENYEFTFECNIEDLSLLLLIFLKEHRVNRLSIGVESFLEKNLNFLNRYHTKEDVFLKIALAKQIGFSNISIDLMYALPGEHLDDLEEDIDFALSLDVSHISLYSLIIEEHTKIQIENIKPISDELDLKMYQLIEKQLEHAGYVHYEVSNYAKKGYESIHNLTYWNNNTYYGFGLGASGYIDNVRYSNTRSLNHYVEGNYRYQEEKISQELEMSNEMILGLRKLVGISLDDFYKKYGKRVEEVYAIQDLLDAKNLEIEKGYLRIPKDKIYVSNAILVRFV